MKSNTINSIILVELPFNIKNLERELEKPNSLIITFDYESHYILSKKNIAHKTSESYLAPQDLDKIRQSSIFLSKWYEQQEIAEFVNYDAINLGKLFYVELNYFLSQFIKKFFELIVIYNNHKNIQFKSTSSLYPMIGSFSESTILIDKNGSQTNFLYDAYKIRITNSISINLSRKTFQKLKKNSEALLSSLLLHKRNLHGEKSVLLVEFDSILYQSLFENSNKHSLNLILFNRRRPAIWNKQSYSIIKNANANVVTDSIINSILKMKIKNSQQQVLSRLNKMWSKNRFFESFFSVDDNSFWNIIKDWFIQLTKTRFEEAVHEIELTKELLSKYKISSILVWSENGFNEQIVISLGKKFKIPVVLLQHGLYNDSLKSVDTLKFAGVLPVESNKFIVWGNTMATHTKNCDISDEKIKILGSPQFDEVFTRKINSKKEYVLFATTSPFKGLVLTEKEIENYYHSIKNVCKTVKKMEKKLIIKTHPDPEELDISAIVKEINSEIQIIKKGNITNLIENCEVFICMDLSTTILEALVLKKPVIVIAVKYDQKDATIFSENSCIYTNLANVENILQKIFSDNTYKEKLIENGNKFIQNYFVNHGKASNAILSFLKDL